MLPAMRPLVVLGSVNADLYVEIDRLPLPGETLPGGGAAVRPGGKGANQAAAAARLGCPVRFVGQVGSDTFAADLRAALAGARVDTAALATVPGPTGQAFILLQRGGENSIIIVGGANRAWDAPPAGFADLLAGAGTLLLQREVPPSVNLAAARAARGAGIPVVLDAGGDDGPLPAELLPLLTVVSPNESELARLTGMPTGTHDEVLAAARALQAAGCGTVLVKLGARGCLLVGREVLAQDAFRVPVVDTTGAGDCFTGAYTAALIAGLPEGERLRQACAAAALCVQGKGALPSMPDGAAVAAFLAARGG
jgi:ribokinase